MNYRIFISFLIPLFFCSHHLSCSKNDVHLARINNDTITLSSFLPRYQSFLSKTFQNDNLSNRHIFLNTLIDENLILTYADQSGILKKPYIIEEKQKIYNQLLLNEYHDKNIIQNISTSDKELRKLFTYYKTKIHVRHLFAKDLETISKIEQKLKQGISWEVLAKKYFADPVLQDNGGNLGWNKMGDLDPAFEIAAFSLRDKEVSQPVKTRRGYSIIQVLGKEQDLLMKETDFQNQRQWLKNMAIAYKKIPQMRKFTDELVEKLDIRFNQDGIHDLQNALQSTLEKSIPSIDTPVLAIHNQEWLNVSKCFSLLNSLSENQFSRLKTSENIQDALKGIIVKNKMIQDAQNMKLDKQEIFESRLIEEYTKLVVNDILTNIDYDSETVNWQNAYFTFRNEIASANKISIDSLAVKSFSFVHKATIL